MADVPQWFSNPIKTSDLFRHDFYICTNCGGQSSGGIYSSVCPQCNGIQSNPPRSARLKYLCNTCARPPICKCDYPVAPRAPTPPPPRPKSPDPCCCSCTWCNFLCRCICCCLKCSWQSSSCKSCCTSQWNCHCCTCYWSWCGCSCSQPPEWFFFCYTCDLVILYKFSKSCIQITNTWRDSIWFYFWLSPVNNSYGFILIFDK